MRKNYNSKQTCWAAVSRTCKNLSEKGLIDVQRTASGRVKRLQTTIHGKKLIRELCNDLEILSLGQYIPKIQKIIDVIKESIDIVSNPEILKNNLEIQKIILEILAKYGELTFEGINFCINIPQKMLDEILLEMIHSSLILKIHNPENRSLNKYLINWKYLFLPIKNIESQ